MKNSRNHAAVLRIAVILLLGGCRPPGGIDLSYQQSEQKIVELVDEALRVGMDGSTLPAKPIPEQKHVCDDPQEASPSYAYHFPLSLLGPQPDSFVSRIEELWRSENFNLDPADEPGMNSSFATTDDGFNLEVVVNRKTGMALVGGSGVCAPAEFE